jgi:drug/metabolite transporter (DMT)-like permease
MRQVPAQAPSPQAFAKMIAGAALISTTSIFVRYAHVPPTVSAFYRTAIGGVILLAALLASRQWRGGARRGAWLMLLPAAAFAIDLWLWHRSIHLIGPGLATLLGNFQVFLMALAGVWLYRERLGLRFVLGLALAFAGLWLLVGRDWSGLTAGYRNGVWLAIVTGVAYAVYMLSFRAAQRGSLQWPAAQWLCLNSLLCAAMLGLAALGEGVSLAIPNTQSWLALLGLGVIGQVLGWLLIARAMPLLPASLVGLLLLLQPLLSFVLDVLLFARPTVPLDWLGLIVSLLGIFVASLRLSPRSAEAEPQ